MPFSSTVLKGSTKTLGYHFRLESAPRPHVPALWDGPSACPAASVPPGNASGGVTPLGHSEGRLPALIKPRPTHFLSDDDGGGWHAWRTALSKINEMIPHRRSLLNSWPSHFGYYYSPSSSLSSAMASATYKFMFTLKCEKTGFQGVEERYLRHTRKPKS